MAFFLLFDLGVLVLNFYTSFKIDQDAVAINLAGRQRYVSQRIARTLLELDAARAAGRSYGTETLAELRAGAKIFDLSHCRLQAGRHRSGRRRQAGVPGRRDLRAGPRSWRRRSTAVDALLRAAAAAAARRLHARATCRPRWPTARPTTSRC